VSEYIPIKRFRRTVSSVVARKFLVEVQSTVLTSTGLRFIDFEPKAE